MYYETTTLLLGANEKICDFSIDDYIVKQIYLKDIDYQKDDYFSMHGEQYIKELYPFYKDIVSGKYYIMLTHTSNGEKNANDMISYSYLDDFQSFPFAYKQGCIDVLKFIKRMQLIAGVNIFPAHIITTKIEDNGEKHIEFKYPFQIPSYRVLKETFQFPASKLNFETFINELYIDLPQGEDKGTLAFEFFIDSLYQRDIKMEYIMLIMALETLLGDENTRHNTLANNYAAFMAINEKDNERLKKDISLMYWTRNQLIHKGKWNNQYGVSNTTALREYIRLALCKYLEEIYGSIEHDAFIKMLR